jgi:8-oxo-dGTP diphosphatase
MKTEMVLGLLFASDRRSVALIEKLRPKWQAGKLNGIGGKIEPGEAPVTAMVREFQEEAGVNIPEENWQYFLTIEGGDWRVYIFRAFGDYHLKTTTDETVLWWALGMNNGLFTDKRIPNLDWIIPMALDADRITGAVTYMDDKFKEFIPQK